LITELFLLGLFASITSLLTAVAGLGGGMLLLALMAQLFAPAVLIPLHGIAQFFSNANRGVIHRKSIEWTYLRPFVLGSVIGAFAFIPLVVFVDATLGALALGLFILLVTWFPKWLNVSRLPFILSGALTSGIGVLFGATGPLAMSAHPKANWTKVGTFLGTKILKRFSDERFKIMLKWVLTILALRLVFSNAQVFLS